MGGGKVFLDTNVLVYAQDLDAPHKRERSRQLLAEVAASGRGVISTLVLKECYVTATREMGVAPLAAKSVVQSLRLFEVVQLSPDLIEQAIDRSVLSQLSFWLALIVAT
ncbi:MAG: PIN domain-containing protein [Gemmatimonadota bacterium]|jgi:predicted nucleic acid-binding protein